MSPEDLFWRRVSRKIMDLHPDMANAYLRSLEVLRGSMTTHEVEVLIESGSVERLIALVLGDDNLDRSFAAFRAELQRTSMDAAAYFAKGIPGEPAIGFNILSPRVIDGIRSLDTRVMSPLKAEMREGVRAFIETGLRAGAGPRETARQIRDIVGLSPNQVDAVSNFRRMLETGDAEAFTRTLRDRRFDSTVRRAFEGGGLSAEQIDRMTSAYQKRMIAFHAETVSRTATLDAMKAGQRASWQSAIEQGVVDADSLVKQWVTVGDKRVRPEHVAMNGEIVPFDQAYSNGEMEPGESTYNCRCLSRVYVSQHLAAA
jgi:SPP1 gp7 family putative phage head morphogenesis protein